MGRKKGQTVSEFMVGRYGYDKLSQFLILLSMVLMLLSVFLNVKYMYLIAILALALGYYRMASKNIKRRKKENEVFLSIVSKFKLKKKFDQTENEGVKRYADFIVTQELGNDEETVYYCYKCRGCGREIREPENKGIVKIVCPDCGRQLIDRT